MTMKMQPMPLGMTKPLGPYRFGGRTKGFDEREACHPPKGKGLGRKEGVKSDKTTASYNSLGKPYASNGYPVLADDFLFQDG